MPSYSGFDVIEKKARKEDYVFTVDGWKKVIRECRVKHPFTVNDTEGSRF